MITISPEGGASIEDTAKKMVNIATKMNEAVSASFNGVWLTANPGGDPESIVRTYWDRVLVKKPRGPHDRYQKLERVRRLVKRLMVVLPQSLGVLTVSETEEQYRRGFPEYTWAIGSKSIVSFGPSIFRGTVTRKKPIVALVLGGNEAIDLWVSSFSDKAFPILNEELALFSRGAGMTVFLEPFKPAGFRGLDLTVSIKAG